MSGTDEKTNSPAIELIRQTAESAIAGITSRAAEFRAKLAARLPEPEKEPVLPKQEIETIEYSEPEFVRAVREAIFAQKPLKQPDAGIPAAQKEKANARRPENAQQQRKQDARPAKKAQQNRFPQRTEGRMQQLQRLADEVAEELPKEFFQKLEGGVALTDAMKYHPQSVPSRPLLILGEYRNDRCFGRSIMLYGGSILRTYGGLPEPALKDELRRIIRHEFTHHIESLCGERGLEIWDEYRLAEYKEGITEQR